MDNSGMPIEKSSPTIQQIHIPCSKIFTGEKIFTVPSYTKTVYCSICQGISCSTLECISCKGRKVFTCKVDTKTTKLQKGNTNVIILIGEGDQSQGKLPGDRKLIINITEEISNTDESIKWMANQQKELTLRKTIDLAYCFHQFSFEFLTLNGIALKTKLLSLEDKVISKDTKMYIEGQGFPRVFENQERGVLHVQFVVKFPKRIPIETQKKLRNFPEFYYPLKELEISCPSHKVVTLEDINLDEENLVFRKPKLITQFMELSNFVLSISKALSRFGSFFN